MMASDLKCCSIVLLVLSLQFHDLKSESSKLSSASVSVMNMKNVTRFSTGSRGASIGRGGSFGGSRGFGGEGGTHGSYSSGHGDGSESARSFSGASSSHGNTIPLNGARAAGGGNDRKHNGATCNCCCFAHIGILVASLLVSSIFFWI